MMKQPKMKIVDNKGNDFGIKKVMSLEWDRQGRLLFVIIDYFDNNDSCEFPVFVDNNGNGFINQHGNLKGELIFEDENK